MSTSRAKFFRASRRWNSVATNVILPIKVKPNSRQEKVTFENGMLLMRVNAPPRDGEANEAVIRLLAELLRIPKSQITIAGGHSSSLKRISIPDGYKAAVDRLVAALT